MTRSITIAIAFSLAWCAISRAATVEVKFAIPRNVPQETIKSFQEAVNHQIAAAGHISLIPSDDPLGNLRGQRADMALVTSRQIAKLQASGFTVFELPFAFDNLAEVAAAQQSAFGEAALNSLSKEGLVGVGFWNFGTQRFFGPKISGIADLKGLKIRVTSTTQLQSSLETLGASTVLPSNNTVQTAFATGKADAVIASPDALIKSRVSDPDKTLTQQPVVPQTYVIVANSRTWNSYPFLIQSSIADGVEAAATTANDIAIKMESQNLRVLENFGVKVASLSEGDVATIRSAVSSNDNQAAANDRLALFTATAIDQIRRLPQDMPTETLTHQSGKAELFFATDRAMEPADNPNFRFGAKRGPLIGGRLKIEFDSDRPAAGTPEKSNITELETASSLQDFASTVAASVGSDPRNSLLLYIHGYANTFGNAAESAATLGSDLKHKGPALLFSWPSDGSAVQYPRDESEEEVSRHSFLELIRVLRAAGVPRINVIAHSMGNRVMAGGLELLSQNPIEASPIFQNIILAAPDIYTQKFYQLIEPLKRFSHRVTLYASNADEALYCSQLLHQGPRAGMAGPNRVVREGVDTIDVSNTEPRSVIDAVTNFLNLDSLYWALSKSCRKGHSYVTRNFSVVNDLHEMLTFNSAPDERILLMKRPLTDGLSFWEMRATAQ